MEKFKLKIMNTGGVFFNGDVEGITLKDGDGKFTVLKNHEKGTIFVYPCKGHIIEEGEKKDLFVSYGIISMEDDGEVFLTCEACEWKEEIDIKRAEESKERAMKRIGEKDHIDIKRAERALMRAIARIKTAS